MTHYIVPVTFNVHVTTWRDRASWCTENPIGRDGRPRAFGEDGRPA